MDHGGTKRTAEVLEIVWLTPDLFELVLDRGGLVFSPGDCISLFAADDEVSRPYSIASGVHERELRFLIRKMEGGVVSNYLSTRHPGEQVRLTPPFGWFRPGQDCEGAPFVFVATGTGIAPFLSYYQSFPDQRPERFFYGVRYAQDAVGWEPLSERWTVDLAVSREVVPNTFRGRVTGLLKHFTVNPAYHFYLCGLDAMIQTVGEYLEARDVDPLNIHREVFFHAPNEPKRLAIHTRR